MSFVHFKEATMLRFSLISLSLLFLTACPQDDPVLEEPGPVLISDEGNDLAMIAMVGNAMAVQGGSVHVVWASSIVQGHDEVYYGRSLDGGVTWDSAVRLTDAVGSVRQPLIRAWEENLYVVWRDMRDKAEGEVYFKSSKDNGSTWGEDTRLTNDDKKSALPTITVAGETVYVAWEHYEPKCSVHFRRSLDGGETWSKSIQITGQQEEGGPALAVGDGGVLHFVYASQKDSDETNGYNWELYHRMSEDQGKSWNDPVRLTYDKIGDSRFPVLAASSGTLHVVWWDDRNDTSIPHFGYPPINPEADHNFEIYYKRSSDNGVTWETDVRLTTAKGVGRAPAVISSVDDVYIAWQDNRDGNEEIYFKSSQDGGMSWSADERLTEDLAVSQSPSIAIDSVGNRHVTWSDKREGSYQVYFEKGAVLGK
jgi:hypothetical protein